MKVARVAMMSYNTFVNGQPNGWVTNGDNAVLLLQNERGDLWGIETLPMREGIEKCRSLIDNLWAQLQAEMATLDAFMLYVGAEGAEHVIELAAQHGLRPEQANFILCDCGYRTKRSMIERLGFGSSLVIKCECGGHNTMARIYREILEQGQLPTRTT